MATVAIDIRVIGRKRTGDETVFLELCTQLIRCHPEHQYYLLTDKTEEDLVLVQEKLSIPVCPPHVEIFNFSPQNKFWWNAYTAPRFLRRHREIDIFHTQYILPLFLPKELQVVAHIHDISFARFPHLIGFWDRLFLQLCIPYTMKRATLAVPSVFTKQEIQAVYNVPASRIVVIYNAVSLRFTTLLENSSSDQVEAVVQKYNLPKKYWLYVGTLQPRKNIPYLIQLLSEVKKRLPELGLVLAGDREGHHFDQKINETLTELQQEQSVVFPGYIADEDLPAVYQGAGVFVFPSQYEGFGIPVLEALAAHIQVAASDIPVHQEIAQDQVTYFPLDNLASAAEILYNLSVQTNNEKLLQNGFLELNSNFSWQKSAISLADFYQHLVKQKNNLSNSTRKE